MVHSIKPISKCVLHISLTLFHFKYKVAIEIESDMH